jgi:hypothetical protein
MAYVVTYMHWQKLHKMLMEKGTPQYKSKKAAFRLRNAAFLLLY